MRPTLGIAALLMIAALLCRFDGSATDLASGQQPIEWVRTAQGWERASAWSVGDVSPVRLHPLVVAAGQALLSILALAYFTEEEAEIRRTSELTSA